MERSLCNQLVASPRDSREPARRRPAAFLCPRVGERGAGGPLRRALAFAGGIPLCLLGVLMIPTPFPGAVPFTAGIALLSGHNRTARRIAIRIQWKLRSLRPRRDRQPVDGPPEHGQRDPAAARAADAEAA